MDIVSTLITLVFCGATAVQLFFWIFIFSKLAFFNQNKHLGLANSTDFDTLPIPQQAVSVVICARNEAENLRLNLPKILTQDYPNFEVIVVNDVSTDDTARVLDDFSKTYAHLKIVTLSEKKGLGKKSALAEGIEQATYDWLLMTDADCAPLSNRWIAGMMQGILCDKEMVLGYAPYAKRDSSFLNKFIRFETVWTATQYLSFALIGQPYMGVGRNLLYNKKLYRKVNGFEKHKDLASGDDDLFVNQVITQKNFSIILHEDTFMVSEPKTQWKSYFTQKKRHLSAGNRYLLKHKIMLGMVSVSHFFFFVTIILASYAKISTMFAVANIVVRTILIWTVYAKILRKLHEERLLWWIPLLDVFYVFFYLVFASTIILRAPPHRWR
ncbi:MAG: glycosyltransferase [Saprospiraceae bacterium]|nr:glycosyltransferase [Saprospiraceae bacterium]